MTEAYEPSEDELAEQYYNNEQAEIQYQRMLEDNWVKHTTIATSFQANSAHFIALGQHRINPNFIMDVDLQFKRSEGLFGVRINYTLAISSDIWFFPYDSIEAQAICEAFGFEIPEELKKLASETRCKKDDIPF